MQERNELEMKWNIKNDKIRVLVETYGRAGIAMILIIVICVMLAKFSTTQEQAKEQTTVSQPVTIVEQTTEEQETETVLAGLQKDAYPEIQSLMERYFEAKLKCDVEALGQIVYPIAGYTVEGLENDLGIPESEAFRRVEDYRNVVCYTKPGLLADTYVVWVYYETKYVNVETTAPCMFKAYVCTDETGVYIYNDTIEGEISNYLDEVSQDADVIELVNSVNQQLVEAYNHDPDLKNIYDILLGVTEPQAEAQTEQ